MMLSLKQLEKVIIIVQTHSLLGTKAYSIQCPKMFTTLLECIWFKQENPGPLMEALRSGTSVTLNQLKCMVVCVIVGMGSLRTMVVSVGTGSVGTGLLRMGVCLCYSWYRITKKIFTISPQYFS